MNDVQPHARYCHGCTQYDDAPRVHAIPDANDPATTKLYHYQCAPPDVAAALHDPVAELVDAGHKDDALRSQIVAVAATLEG